jgi:radical SAM protein with 4Fe4S-binding SPASM domain
LIGVTKLVCGTATVSEAIKYCDGATGIPANLLQFSAGDRPVVVWNSTNRCNLVCRHCYLSAGPSAGLPDELTTTEAEAMIEDLAQMRAPVLLFSGGEPLLREDFFHLADYARQHGLRAVVSTNGALITEEVAQRIKEAGIAYVGVSLDGLREVHDRFRGVPGAFDAAVAGIRNSLAAGNKTGVRFTLNSTNYRQLPELIDFAVGEGIQRFCLYHLVYSGRGKTLVEQDPGPEEKRQTINFLIEKAKQLDRNGIEFEILTVDNHADGVYIRNYIAEHQPERLAEVEQLLRMHGGCSAGKKIACIDARGDVHPCQFWGHLTLGNVRQKPLSAIWRDKDNSSLNQLRNMKTHLRGKCGNCSFMDICAGCRIRAEAVSGNLWAEDPACYLSREEVETQAREAVPSAG